MQLKKVLRSLYKTLARWKYQGTVIDVPDVASVLDSLDGANRVARLRAALAPNHVPGEELLLAAATDAPNLKQQIFFEVLAPSLEGVLLDGQNFSVPDEFRPDQDWAVRYFANRSQLSDTQLQRLVQPLLPPGSIVTPINLEVLADAARFWRTSLLAPALGRRFAAVLRQDPPPEQAVRFLESILPLRANHKPFVRCLTAVLKKLWDNGKPLNEQWPFRLLPFYERICQSLGVSPPAENREWFETCADHLKDLGRFEGSDCLCHVWRDDVFASWLGDPFDWRLPGELLRACLSDKINVEQFTKIAAFLIKQASARADALPFTPSIRALLDECARGGSLTRAVVVVWMAERIWPTVPVVGLRMLLLARLRCESADLHDPHVVAWLKTSASPRDQAVLAAVSAVPVADRPKTSWQVWQPLLWETLFNVPNLWPSLASRALHQLSIVHEARDRRFTEAIGNVINVTIRESGGAP